MPKKISKKEYVDIFKQKYPTLELLSEYNGDKNYITVRCIIHDYIFNTKPNWLKHGQGCKKCYNDRRSKTMLLTTKDFIKRAKEIHKDKYDYSKVEYKGSKNKVCIICPEHGEFWQTPNKHICCKQGCPKCGGIKNGINKRLGNDKFIERARKIHNNRYDYSKVEYIDYNTKVCIICPEHGEFWQTPQIHLLGKCGCPICNESHLERDIRLLLQENNINFEQQKRFEWLGRQSLDFYLPDYNIAIECQGLQHFKEIEHFGGKDEFKKLLRRDSIKNTKCLKNNIKIFYIVDNINLVKIKGKVLNRLYEELYEVNKFSDKINKIKNILQS